MIRVLSDLHCAHPASLVEEFSQIEPLLEGAKQVVFNGDSVEWRLAKTRKRAEGFLESVKELCRQLGAEAVFLNGNHDAGISNLNHLKLMENRVLVTHGDIFFDGISPWAREAVRLRENHERLIRKHAPDSLEKQLWVMRQACLQTLPANSDLPERKLVRVWNLLADYLQPRKAREVWR